MSDGLVFDIDARDNATPTISKVNREVDQLGNSAQSVGPKLDRTGASSSSLMGNLTKLGKAAGVAFAAFQGAQYLHEAVEVAREYQVVSGDLRQAIINTTPGLEAQKAAWDEMTAAIEYHFDTTGVRIPELQQAMVDLTIRTDEVGNAQERLSRIMGAVNLTGKGAREVAKGIGEAYTGNIAPLKELGLLNDAQIKSLMLITDTSQRAAAAFEIADKKLEGYADGLPASTVSTNKLAASWDRLKAAIGSGLLEFAPINATLGATGELVNASAKQVENFVKAWNEAPPSIAAAVAQSNAAIKEMSATAETEISRLNKAAGESQINHLMRQRDGMKGEIERLRQLGEITEWDAMTRIEGLEKRTQERINAIIVERGLYEAEKLTDAQKRADLLAGELEILMESDPKKQAQLKAEQAITAQKQRQAAELENITDVEQRRQISAVHELENEKLRIINEQALAAQKTSTAKATETAEQKALKRMAADHAIYMQWITERAEAEADRIKAYIDGQRAQIDLTKELIAEQAKADAAWESTKSQIQEVKDMAAEDAEVSAAGQGKRIGYAAMGARAAGAAFGDVSGSFDAAAAEAQQKAAAAVNDAERERYERLAAQNAEIAQQVRGYQAISGAVGDLGKNLAEIATKQWDFSSASEATVGALNAVGAAGAATAGALGGSIQKQAGVRAGFETAAAAAALGAGLFTGNPAFFAAAGQHGLAAALFGAQATGAIGGGSASASGGGGTASTVNAQAFDVAAEREKTAEAFASKLAAMNSEGPRQITLSLGSNNVYMRDSDEFGRELVRKFQDAMRNF